MRFAALRDLVVLFPQLARLIARLAGDPAGLQRAAASAARIAACVPLRWKARVFGSAAA